MAGINVEGATDEADQADEADCFGEGKDHRARQKIGGLRSSLRHSLLLPHETDQP
jgi:hypothetical protein